jgi:hypothetical protein
MLVAEIGDFLKYYHDHLSISCLVDGTSSLLSRPSDLYFPICGLPDHNQYVAPVMRRRGSFWCVGVGYWVHTRHVFETLNQSGILLFA